MRGVLLLLLLVACVPKARPANVAESEVDLTIPSADQFTFGAGDVFTVLVWRHDDLTMDITIAPDGGITYPLVGRIQIAGMTYDQIVKTLEAAIAKYYVDAQVSVNVKQVNSQPILVFGEVAAPGTVQLTKDMTVLEAVVRAGGINQNARTDNVLLIRDYLDQPQRWTVDIGAIYGRGDFSQMVFLRRGDIIVVPAKTITNVERFFKRVTAILSPAVSASAVYRNVISGDGQVPPQQ